MQNRQPLIVIVEGDTVGAFAFLIDRSVSTIHVLILDNCKYKDVDARHKAGHDV